MGVDEGSEGYGFARRNNQTRKKVGNRPAVHSNAPVGPSAYASSSQKPAWVWLLIGFLIGTGSTLLTASFWLPIANERHIAVLEANERPSQADRPESTAADPSEPKSESPSVAALDIEIPTAKAEGNEPLSDPDAPANAALDQAEKAGTPDGETEREGQEPIDVSGAGDAADERRLDDRPSTASPNQEQVLASLDPEIPLIDVDQPRPRPEPQQLGSDDDRLDETAPSDPQTESPVTETARSDPPIAEPTDDRSPTADDSPEVKEAKAQAAPPDSQSRRELPPRIRQALQSARAKATSDGNGEGGGGSGRLYRVQLAAVENEAAARVFWREANDRLPGVFTDVEPIFDQRLVDERLYLRIWVGAFDNRLDADSYCGWLKLKGQDCFVTRVDNL